MPWRWHCFDQLSPQRKSWHVFLNLDLGLFSSTQSHNLVLGLFCSLISFLQSSAPTPHWLWKHLDLTRKYLKSKMEFSILNWWIVCIPKLSYKALGLTYFLDLSMLRQTWLIWPKSFNCYYKHSLIFRVWTLFEKNDAHERLLSFIKLSHLTILIIWNTDSG